jgi:hypothetical protein
VLGGTADRFFGAVALQSHFRTVLTWSGNPKLGGR